MFGASLGGSEAEQEDPMRVGMIAPPWAPIPPPSYGGTEEVIDCLARGILERGHEVVLFTTGDSSTPVPRRWCFERAEWARIGSAAVEAHHVLDAYEQLADCDVVHDHTTLGALLASRAACMPVVVTQHGLFDDDARRILGAADDCVSIVAISHNHAATAGEVKVSRVIHHGIDPDTASFGPAGGDHLVFLGRMTPEKGVREAALIAHEAGMPLLIAAKMREPAEIEYFHTEVEGLLDDRVRYVGEVDYDGKMALLRGAAALLNPIQWPEPFGLVMIEALACGTPVVAMANGAAPEIVESGVTGFLCDDLADMPARLREIASIDRRACRRAVEEHFSAARMVDDYLKLYKELVDAAFAA